MSDSTKHISLQVRDQGGTVYTVRLRVAEQNEAGTLSILTASGELAQQFELTRLKKDKDGTRLTCNVSGTTATLSLERDKNQPQLRVSASLFFPIFDAVYQIDAAEQERFVAWINDLRVGILTSS
jgi:hypothetical protein